MPDQCLIVIDMLNDFLDRWEALSRRRLIARLNDLVGSFHSRALPVIWIRQQFKEDLSDATLEMRDENIRITIEGTRGSQIHADLACQGEDTVIVKKRYSAFFGTKLGQHLADLGIDRIVLAGVNTHACIRTSAIDAYQRDLRVILAKECIGSYDTEHAQMSLRYMEGKIAKIMSNTEIEMVLDQA